MVQFVEDVANNFWGIFLVVLASSVIYDNMRNKH